jgi:NAD(P)-dependent dehydrogenase (short-subunit alcohol dehydrogenase family)
MVNRDRPNGQPETPPPASRVALVTGGNRGIGREIARQLSRMGLTVLIGCRDEAKGRAAAGQLAREGAPVRPEVLDVSSRDSIDALMERVRGKYGRLDVLVNNAGIILDRGVSVLEVGESVVRQTLETNFFGPLRLIQAAVPLMRKHRYGRIVNVSSGLGTYQAFELLPELKGQSGAYRLSKSLLNYLTGLAAREVDGRDIKINAVCPGSVRTDMGGPDAPLSAEEGADTAVWLATIDTDGPNGGFFRYRGKAEW